MMEFIMKLIILQLMFEDYIDLNMGTMRFLGIIKPEKISAIDMNAKIYTISQVLFVDTTTFVFCSLRFLSICTAEH